MLLLSNLLTRSLTLLRDKAVARRLYLVNQVSRTGNVASTDRSLLTKQLIIDRLDTSENLESMLVNAGAQQLNEACAHLVVARGQSLSEINEV